MLATTLACLALLAASLLVWQWVAASRFPLNQRSPLPNPSQRPALSILKPVTGADPGTQEALASWLTQSYPGPVEVLFGVGSPDDPAHALVKDLLDRHPDSPARLVLCSPNPALNRKVGKLIHLAREASSPILVVSDADVSAPPDLLAQATALLDDPHTGLVHCLYRFADAPTPATRWEAFVVNGDFWSQVLQHLSFKPLEYALGAVMMVRRSDLAAIGGFEALADDLADDNRLGRKIVQLGRNIRLCPIVVDCRAAPADWVTVWRHQLRWAITIRVCQPGPYFLSIFANGTLWPLLWAASAPSPLPLSIATVLLAFRVVQGLSLESRFTGNPRDWAHAWLAPLKDLLQVALWACAFLQHHVDWRGARHEVGSDGRLRNTNPLPPAPRLPSPPSTPATPTLPGSGFGIPPRSG